MAFLKNDRQKKWLSYFVVSFISALFAWYLERFFSGLTTLYFSYDLNIKAVLSSEGIRFLTPVTSSAWTRDTLVTLNLAAPIMNLFLGLFMMALYVFVPRKTMSMALFMIWMMVFSFTGIFGSYVENNVAHTGLYELSKIMNIGVVFQIIFVVLSLYFLYIMGIAIGKLVMLTIPASFKKEDKIMFSFFLLIFLVPWILVLVITLKGLSSSSLFTYLLGIVLLLPFNWMQEPEKKGIRLKPLPDYFSLDTFALIVYLLGIFFIRAVLSSGMSL
ncbi:hypothetical protein LA303_00560 [Candidatus Sulfidibacterium hydrothermale]|uniref:hypothetical protein n=1 Tax=Candidatus Sulfidibacterium hydrothermale TaxID=2875962 RepID=UPI001F0ADD2A|nr:hypothetical protein [Candidatus Sulfidibacterium hydrothermale]UBM62487.1 hypothetical protein LA303_00560 [Candidatus Sulfidibacterium hydrothermale]